MLFGTFVLLRPPNKAAKQHRFDVISWARPKAVRRASGFVQVTMRIATGPKS